MQEGALLAFLLFCCRELQPACTRKKTSAACSRGGAQQQRSPPSQQQRTVAFSRSALPPLNAQFQHLYMWVLFAVMPLGFQARTATIAEAGTSTTAGAIASAALSGRFAPPSMWCERTRQLLQASH